MTFLTHNAAKVVEVQTTVTMFSQIYLNSRASERHSLITERRSLITDASDNSVWSATFEWSSLYIDHPSLQWP